MEETKNTLMNDLVKISRELGRRGWVPGSSGNVSVIIPGTRQAFIKITGRRLLNITSSDILTVDLDRKILEGNDRPTKEVRFHLGIYKIRNDVKAVIHAHQPFVTAFAIAGLKLPLLTAPGKAILKKIPMVKFSSPGSEELAKDVVRVFKDPEVKAAILQRHAAKEAFLTFLLKKIVP